MQPGDFGADAEERDLWFDPWLTCEGDKLRTLAEAVFHQTEALTERGDRKPRGDAVARRFEVTATLVANLAALVLRPESGQRLAVSLRHDAMTRYDRQDFPRKVLPKVVRSLELIGATVFTLGKRRGYSTTLSATPAFVRRLRRAGATVSDIGRLPGGETIILKESARYRGAVKALVDYADTHETRRLRKEMERINTFLNDAKVTIEGRRQLPFLLTRFFQIAEATGPHTFDRHGRIYGGFWINMHRAQRDRLRINGEELADLDFKAMFAQLAYIEAGQPLPDGDPYDGVPGLELSGVSDPSLYAQRRDAIKRTFNAFLFRTGRMSRTPQAVRDALGPEWNATRLAEAIHNRHAPIKHLFGTGIGLKLMHTESMILTRTLLDLIDVKVPALPIHDGIMVPGSKQALAEQTMRAASRAILGVELPVTVKASPTSGRPGQK